MNMWYSLFCFPTLTHLKRLVFFFFKQRQLNSDRSNSNYMDTFILSVR